MRQKSQSEKHISKHPSTGSKPLYLAPLRGVTDAIYRTIYAEHFDGIDLAVAPFVTTHAGRRIKPSHVRDLWLEANPIMPVIPQVLTKNADDCIVLAEHLFDMGYGTINLNCGCPFPQVAKKGRGSGLLCNPDGLDRLLERLLSQIPNRLSVKTRLGRHHADEIRAVMAVFNRYPLASVIVHPRTGVQMYGGAPDLEAFSWCLQNCRHPVIYNGDINDPSGFRELERRFEPVAGWMIGRGVLANPYLPGLLKGAQPDDDKTKTSRFRQFHNDLLDRYSHRLSGPGHLLDRMKGLWKYFSQGFRNSETARKRIHKTRSIDQYQSAVAAFLENEPAWLS